jgi:hypothetical protein
VPSRKGSASGFLSSACIAAPARASAAPTTAARHHARRSQLRDETRRLPFRSGSGQKVARGKPHNRRPRGRSARPRGGGHGDDGRMAKDVARGPDHGSASGWSARASASSSSKTRGAGRVQRRFRKPDDTGPGGRPARQGSRGARAIEGASRLGRVRENEDFHRRGGQVLRRQDRPTGPRRDEIRRSRFVEHVGQERPASRRLRRLGPDEHDRVRPRPPRTRRRTALLRRERSSARRCPASADPSRFATSRIPSRTASRDSPDTVRTGIPAETSAPTADRGLPSRLARTRSGWRAATASALASRPPTRGSLRAGGG